MSLRINKDNIVFVLPESRYAVSKRIDSWMDESFTLHVTAKLFPELLTEKESFIISRNGMHSGISAFKDSSDNTNIVFTYWFKKPDGTSIPKQIFYALKDSELDDFNEYTMICDHYRRKDITCFVNGYEVGTIPYEDDKKESYKNCFYWFGCGSMIGPEEHQSIGNFEFDLAFICPVKLNISEVIDLIDNYDLLYSIDVFNGMRKLKREIQKKYNFAFFCDFKNYNRYKVWDLSFSGNYPQFYIEDNIYF